MITGTLSDHFKFLQCKGQVNFKAQLSAVAITFSNTPAIATLPSSAVTAGFEVGDKVYSNSLNALNKGPFLIKAIGGGGNVAVTLMTLAGADPTLTAGAETGVTFGTSILQCMLTRSGFSFNKSTYGKLINFQSSLSGGGNTVIISGTNTVGMAAGGFTAAGFVVGNAITFAGFGTPGNNATFKISLISDVSMQVTHLDGSAPSLTNNGAGETGITFTTSDELANGNGYTTGGVVSGVPVLTEDDVNSYAQVVCPTISWSASGGSIGPSASLMIFDRATPDVVCCGNLDFSGDATAVTGSSFTVAGITFRVV